MSHVCFHDLHTTYLLEQRPVIRLGYPDRGIWGRFRVRQEISLSPKLRRPVLGRSQLPTRRVPGRRRFGVKHPGCMTALEERSTAKVRNEWLYTTISHMTSWLGSSRNTDNLGRVYAGHVAFWKSFSF